MNRKNEKLSSVKLKQRDEVHETIRGLEDKADAAERRAQDMEFKVLQLSKDKTKKVVGGGPPDDPGDGDWPDPDDFDEGSYTATTRKMVRRNPLSAPQSQSPRLLYP